MPLPDAAEIANRRRSLKLGQTELARRAGVSQSLVTKLERGKADAAYSTVKRLLEIIEELEAEKKPVPVKNLSHRHVVGVQVTDSMSKAIGLMQQHGYSQLPVFDGERVVGSISERSVTDYLAESKDPVRLPNAPVSDLMDEAFPQVGEETRREVVVSLLRHVPAVLTTKEGMVTGIVTRADLFKVVGGA